MGNRFYVEPRNSFLDVGRLGLQLYGLKQQKDIALGQQALTEKELGLRGEQLSLLKAQNEAEYGTPEKPGLKQQGIDVQGRLAAVHEEQNRLTAEKQDAEKPIDERDFGTVSAMMATKHLEKLGVPKDYFLIQKIKEMAPDKNITNSVAMNELMRDYPSYRFDLAEKIADDYTKKVEKDPNYANTPQGKAQNQMIAALDADATGEKVIGSYFPGTFEAMQRRQAPAMSAEASLLNAAKPQLFSLDQLLARTVAGGRMSMEDAFTLKQKAESSPEIIKLIDAYNTSADPAERNMIMARMNKLTETTGLAVRVGKDGEVELIQGPGVKSGGLSKVAQTDVEKKLITSTESLSRLGAIESLYQPEYQQIGTKWSAWAAAAKEKAGFKLQGTEKAALEDFSKFRRRAYENLNKYLNEMSGAAITPQEAARLQKALPNAGEGILDGDSPTEFKAKMDDAIQSQRWAVARYNYALKNGLSWKTISLENMPDIVNEKAAQIEAELSKTVADPNELKKAVRQRLDQEFGLMGK